MGENSKIEWTHHTFNPWRGCTKVSAGCANCYAERMSGRNPAVLGVWGPKGTRVIASEAMWQEPIRWNKEAMRAGERRRVFCASLADVFEGRDTMPEESWEAVEAARLRLMVLIALTPNLDWLLLTKRPGNAREFFAGAEKEVRQAAYVNALRGIGSNLQAATDQGIDWPLPNVWVGTSVENQAAADERIPELLRVPAKVRFLSCEPLLGAVNLAGLFDGVPRPDWVIAGGESGPAARPMHPAWVRSIRDQCQGAGVPFHFKQWGEWAPVSSSSYAGSGREKSQHIAMLRDGRVAYEDKGPAFGSVVSDESAHRLVDREMSRDENLRKKLAKTGLYPGMKAYHEQRGESFAFDRIGYQWMARLGKKKAGRKLDGRVWDEFPPQPSPKASAGDLRSGKSASAEPRGPRGGA